MDLEKCGKQKQDSPCTGIMRDKGCLESTTENLELKVPSLHYARSCTAW
jgi:hypothetical protein